VQDLLTALQHHILRAHQGGQVWVHALQDGFPQPDTAFQAQGQTPQHAQAL
jgi:hypothetical protein